MKDKEKERERENRVCQSGVKRIEVACIGPTEIVDRAREKKIEKRESWKNRGREREETS